MLKAIADISPVLLAEAPRFETERKLTDEAAAAMRSTGVYRMAMPRAWGGPEFDPLVQTRAVEALSAIDGSAGWCAMIGSDGGYLTSFLEDGVGRAMYPDLDEASVFVVAPGGAAIPVDGGYMVTGRWPFASGSAQAGWFGLGCIVPGPNGPKMLTAEMPEVRVCVLPRAEVEVHDTWFTTGVRGSGSNDVSVANVFVPAERTFSVLDGEIRRPGALYAWRWMFTVNMLGVPLGIAGGALDEVIALAPGRKGARGAPAMEEPSFTNALGEAAALIRSAQAFAYTNLAEVWASLEAGELPPPKLRAETRLALTHAMDSCTRAVDLLYRIAGSSALYSNRSTLDRRLRDIYTVRQHVLVNLNTYSAAGRVLLGLESGVLGF